MADILSSQPTARTLIERSMRLVKQLSVGQSATDDQLNSGLGLLNELLESWNLDGSMIYEQSRDVHTPHGRAQPAYDREGIQWRTRRRYQYPAPGEYPRGVDHKLRKDRNTPSTSPPRSVTRRSAQKIPAATSRHGSGTSGNGRWQKSTSIRCPHPGCGWFSIPGNRYRAG